MDQSEAVARKRKPKDFQKQLEAFMKEQKASQKLQEEAIAVQNERLHAQSEQIERLQAALGRRSRSTAQSRIPVHSSEDDLDSQSIKSEDVDVDGENGVLEIPMTSVKVLRAKVQR